MMCGRTYPARGPASEDRRGGRHLFGLDVERSSPKAQIVVALSVLVPVALSGLALVAFVPELWWIFTTYGWVAFPAFGLLARGLAGAGGEAPEEAKERELLRALRDRGGLTPARAAMETSLSVAEAEKMLEDLAGAGHLAVRARGGALYYALWDAPVSEQAAVEGTRKGDWR